MIFERKEKKGQEKKRANESMHLIPKIKPELFYVVLLKKKKKKNKTTKI